MNLKLQAFTHRSHWFIQIIYARREISYMFITQYHLSGFTEELNLISHSQYFNIDPPLCSTKLKILQLVEI